MAGGEDVMTGRNFWGKGGQSRAASEGGGDVTGWWTDCKIVAIKVWGTHGGTDRSAVEETDV